MKNKTGSFVWARQWNIDWKLLLFLLLFLNVKLLVKIAAIILICILRRDLKFGFRLKDSRLPLFYLLAIAIAVFNWLTGGRINDINYGLVALTGIFFWVLCIFAAHQVKLSVEQNEPTIIHRTIVIFFIINALVSLVVYTGIVWETGRMNPYLYQGNYQKYFIGTGDYIKGITFDTSTTNAVLNAFGVIYFLFRGKNMLVLLCMAVLLLTGSNMTNLILCATLIFVFFFQSGKIQKSMIIICLTMLAIFLVKISPQNNRYVANAYQRLFNKNSGSGTTTTNNIPITLRHDSTLTNEEKKRKTAQRYMDSVSLLVFEKKQKESLTKLGSLSITGLNEKRVIPKDSIHTPRFQHVNDTTAIEKELMTFVNENPGDVPLAAGKKSGQALPGKIAALQQTFEYFKEHPWKILTGTGIGNFSSKLAFRGTGLKVAGGYPKRFTYINNDFKSNHLDLYLYYFTNKDDYHSITNSPNSAYDGLISEYGLAGLFSFAAFYIGFFVKQVKKHAYAIPLLLFMLGIFFIEYWFEQLSVVIFFELLVLLNIKETTLTWSHETT